MSAVDSAPGMEDRRTVTRTRGMLPTGILLSALGLFGCDEGSDPPPGGELSCIYLGQDAGVASVPEGAFCATYSGSVVPTSCAAAPSYGPIDACPDGAVADCEIRTETSAGVSVTHLRTYPPFSVETARSACDASGGTLTEL